MTRSDRNSACRPATGVAVAVLLSLVFAGCAGYRHGSLMHPGVKSIAIGDVENHTDEPRAALYVRQHVAQLLQRDGSLRLASRESADCVIQASILSYDVRSIGRVESTSSDNEQRQYRTTVYGIDAEMEFRVDLRRREKPLIPAQRVTGRAEFTELIDLDAVKEDGLKQALFDASQQLVAAVTEAW